MKFQVNDRVVLHSNPAAGVFGVCGFRAATNNYVYATPVGPEGRPVMLLATEDLIPAPTWEVSVVERDGARFLETWTDTVTKAEKIAEQLAKDINETEPGSREGRERVVEVVVSRSWKVRR